MSKTHDDAPDGDCVIDGNREWAIYRCSHGCLHVTLDRFMVTLTDDEFHALLELMRRARQRFHESALVAPSVARAH